MPWWQVLLILAIAVMLLGFYYYSRSVAKQITSGETRDKEVGARVSKHKIMANPIIWAYLIVIFIVLAVTVYLIFLYPEAAHRGS